MSYTINKCNDGELAIFAQLLQLSQIHISAVCWLRLDFDTFSLLGTGATTETNGGECQDTFTVTVSDDE